MAIPLSNRPGGRLSHRRAQQMSKRFAEVGVEISPVRLQQLSTGAPAAECERFDIDFAITVYEIKRGDRSASYARARRNCRQFIIMVIMTLVALSMLIGAAYPLLRLAAPHV